MKRQTKQDQLDELKGDVGILKENIGELRYAINQLEDFNKEMCLISISKSEVKKLIKNIEDYLGVELTHVKEYDYYVPKRKSK